MYLKHLKEPFYSLKHVKIITPKKQAKTQRLKKTNMIYLNYLKDSFKSKGNV